MDIILSANTILLIVGVFGVVYTIYAAIGRILSVYAAIHYENPWNLQLLPDAIILTVSILMIYYSQTL